MANSEPTTSSEAPQLVALIVAVGANRAIGLDNQLLWRLPEDMAYFKATTQGRPVIMGRKTWESLPEKFRPLPGRRNVVVSRNRDYLAPGAILAHSLEEALAAAGGGEVFVMGGADLYAQALPLARRLYLTEVRDEPRADAFFPAGAPAYDFVVWERRPR